MDAKPIPDLELRLEVRVRVYEWKLFLAVLLAAPSLSAHAGFAPGLVDHRPTEQERSATPFTVKHCASNETGNGPERSNTSIASYLMPMQAKSAEARRNVWAIA
jgi:hypothetical protein